MSNICSFNLRITGSAAELQKFRDAILRDTEPLQEDSPFYGQYVLMLKTDSWGEHGCHEFLWLTEMKYHRCEQVLGDCCGSVCDEISLDGEAKYCPPVEFVIRAMATLPSLDFDLHGTTEHELYEHWQSRLENNERTLFCREVRLSDPKDGLVQYLEVDGQIVIGEAQRCLDWPRTGVVAGMDD